MSVQQRRPMCAVVTDKDGIAASLQVVLESPARFVLMQSSDAKYA